MRECACVILPRAHVRKEPNFLLKYVSATIFLKIRLKKKKIIIIVRIHFFFQTGQIYRVLKFPLSPSPHLSTVSSSDREFGNRIGSVALGYETHAQSLRQAPPAFSYSGYMSWL